MEYKKIIEHYEECFEKFGDTPQGVDWTKEEQVESRYNTMLELINFREKSFQITENISLLDYGCGLSHLYEYIVKNNIDYVEYTGLEISNKFFEVSKKKFPDNTYIKGDILKDNNLLKNKYDYIIINGVFTEKRDLSYQDMFSYFEKMIEKIYEYCDKGIAFNVMSKQVDWEIDTLFHVPMDDMANFLTKKISRNFIIRNDYGLYEYTVYLYKAFL
ncbi:MAG: class I SAM-dependent methyltransferase [Sulfurimonas sp.]|nr:class I SAM-dependent methyltransferase [Sulfurimonas sp.]